MEKPLTHDILLHATASKHNEIAERYFLFNQDEPIKLLPNFNRINVFVGANNSGKSWFIRFLMHKKQLTGYHRFEELENARVRYNEIISSIGPKIQFRFESGVQDELKKSFSKDELDYWHEGYHSLSLNPLKETFYSDLIIFENEKNGYTLQLLKKVVSILLDDINANVNSIYEFRVSMDSRRQTVRYNPLLTELLYLHGLILDLLKTYVEIGSDKHIYVPTLRSAHALFNSEGKKIEEDIFLDTQVTNYSISLKEIDVFTGLKLHSQILNTRNSKREIRKPFENFEKFLSNQFFGSQEIDIIAEFNKDDNLKGVNDKEVISVYIGTHAENIYKLGDGIQALIILMYKIFMAPEQTIIFIDEPELNLHPGMQRLFFEQISRNPDLLKKNLTYVISTHSNHFLDLTLEQNDVSIYSFTNRRKKDALTPEFEIKNTNLGNNEILRDLGVNNSSVFLANCGIWVEGISDRRYLKAFLLAYTNKIGKPLKEDLDFAFFEYAGSNIKHYVFSDEMSSDEEQIIGDEIKALRLNNRIFLLADSDCVKKSTKKGKRLRELINSNSLDFHAEIIWDVREIENLLTNEIWGHVLIDFCNSHKVKSEEERRVVQKKIDNALKTIDCKDYQRKYIGNFLDAVRLQVPELNKIYEGNQTPFGTFIDKARLSDLVLQAVIKKKITWDILSKNPLIEQLTQSLHKFIVN